MPTLNGPWQGSPYPARIYLVYSTDRTADNTQAIFNGTFGIEFQESVSDSTNSWDVFGDCPEESGSNVSYSIPSGGGKKNFCTMNQFNRYNEAVVTGRVSGINAMGGATIQATFTIPTPDLAPYFSDETYAASSITSTSAVVSGWSAVANGSPLNDTQTQYNTSASATGATSPTRGSYGTSMTLSGLDTNTLYYFRVRVSNIAYGWGAWGPWKSFRTDSGLPGTPDTTWAISDVKQVTADVTGNHIDDPNGSAINGWQVQYNTSASATGADVTTTTGATAIGPMTGLSPGTTYWARIRGKNANGYGPFSGWKSFKTLSGAQVKVGTVWKEAVPYVCISPGVWKIAERYVAISNGSGGVNWKK